MRHPSDDDFRNGRRPCLQRVAEILPVGDTRNGLSGLQRCIDFSDDPRPIGQEDGEEARIDPAVVVEEVLAVRGRQRTARDGGRQRLDRVGVAVHVAVHVLAEGGDGLVQTRAAVRFLPARRQLTVHRREQQHREHGGQDEGVKRVRPQPAHVGRLLAGHEPLRGRAGGNQVRDDDGHQARDDHLEREGPDRLAERHDAVELGRGGDGEPADDPDERAADERPSLRPREESDGDRFEDEQRPAGRAVQRDAADRLRKQAVHRTEQHGDRKRDRAAEQKRRRRRDRRGVDRQSQKTARDRDRQTPRH